MAELSTVTVTWDEEDRPVITVKYGNDGDGSAGVAGDPEAWLKALAEQVSDNGARFLGEMIKANERGEFISLAALAEDINEDKKSVDGWNRNLGRSVKKVVRDLGFLRKDEEDGTAQILDFKWDQPNNQWLYAVPVKYREVLKAGLDNR